MTAKDYLRRVLSLNSAVDAALLQIESIESDLEKITPVYDSVRVSGSGQDRESAIAKLIDARKKCSAAIDRYADHKAEAVELINKLETADHRKILTLLYINGLDWEETAKRTSFSVRQAQRLHGDALNAFEKVLAD